MKWRLPWPARRHYLDWGTTEWVLMLLMAEEPKVRELGELVGQHLIDQRDLSPTDRKLVAVALSRRTGTPPAG